MVQGNQIQCLARAWKWPVLPETRPGQKPMNQGLRGLGDRNWAGFGVASDVRRLRRSRRPFRFFDPSSIPCQPRNPSWSSSSPCTTRRMRSCPSSRSGAPSSHAPSARGVRDPRGRRRIEGRHTCAPGRAWLARAARAPPYEPRATARAASWATSRPRGWGATYVFQIDSDGQCDPAGFASVWERRRKRRGGLRAQDEHGTTVRPGGSSARVLRAFAEGREAHAAERHERPLPPLQGATRGGRGRGGSRRTSTWPTSRWRSSSSPRGSRRCRSISATGSGATPTVRLWGFAPKAVRLHRDLFRLGH